MIWLLDLTWAGRVFRFASEPVTLVDADGVSLPYAGGLVPDYSVGAPIGEIQSDLDVDLGELVFPVDVALWHRSGRPLLGCAAELSTWVSGTWETRTLRVVGTVSTQEYGTSGQPVRVVLRWAPASGARVVPTDAAVTLATSNTADSATYGAPYPRVFGRPGGGLAPSTTNAILATGGTKCTLLDVATKKLLLADGKVYATTATLLRYLSDGTTTAETGDAVSQVTDDLGRTISIVTRIGVIADGDTWGVDWTSTTGGTLRRDSSLPILTFGDLLYWLAGEEPLTFDVAAWRNVVERFSAYLVGYYVDDESSPLDIVRDVALPLLPLSVVPGPRGLRPVVWDLEGATTVALVEGENVSRVSSASAEVDGVRNDVTLRYAPRGDDGQPARTARAFEDTHPGCAASLTYLPRARLDLETAAVYDPGTADLIVAGLASAYALPVERVRYVDLAGLDLQPGDVVSLTDADLHLSARVAHIGAVAYKGASVEYDVLIFTTPGRDTLAT